MGATTNSFEILKCVSRAGRDGLSFSDIVQKTDLPKASVHRLAKELTSLGALTYSSALKTYHSGLLLAHLGGSVTANFSLANAAKPHLKRLHDSTGYVATLGAISDGRGIYLEKVEPEGFGLKLHSEIGREFPLHCTGMGKALLAFGDEMLRETFLKGPLVRYTNNTITSAKALSRELQIIKEQGFALDNEEITAGLTCVAAPIINPENELVGAMSCTFPSSLEDDEGRKNVANRVKQITTEIFNSL